MFKNEEQIRNYSESKRNIDNETVYNYLENLNQTYVLYRILMDIPNLKYSDKT